MSKTKVKYHHEFQQKFVFSKSKFTVGQASRRGGKSTAMGDRMQNCCLSLPFCNFDFITLRLKQAKNEILPNIFATWEANGFKEGIHWVKWKRPPKSWQKPIYQPDNFENVVSIYNGSYFMVHGTLNPKSLRGGTAFAQFYDEFAFMSESFFKDVANARNTGPLHLVKRKFRKSHFLHSTTAISSMPQLDGEWIFQYKDLADEDEKNQNKNYLFLQWDIYAMQHIIGLDRIEALKLELGEDAFNREFGNKRNQLPPNSYYFNYDYNRHTYANKGRRDPYYRADQPIRCSWDFNGNFRSCVIAQEFKEGEHSGLAFIDELYKETMILGEMVEILTQRYINHRKKVIFIGGDPSGNKGDMRVARSLFTDIRKAFERQGWVVVPLYETYISYPNHEDRREFLNKCFKAHQDLEYQRCWTIINQHRCLSLAGALKYAKIKKSQLGKITKEKKGEKTKDLNKRRYATDFTDAYDYMAYHYFKTKEGSISYVTDTISDSF